MGRILLVEDSPDTQLLVRRSLEECAEVTVASSQDEALALLHSQEFDILIVDVQLPDGDGFGLCATMLAAKSTNRPRVLFLTGRGELSDKLTGFSVGGDDYLVKPVDPLELKARVQAQLRHSQEELLRTNVLRLGNLRLDLASHQALVKSADREDPVDLTPTEFRLLQQLARREGQVHSREQLLEGLSGGKVHVSDRTIDAHICRLRKKLEQCTHTVEPIYGVGYRFQKKTA